MSLKPLIKNQKLRIDDHKWGAGEVKDWNDSSSDIHLDKETNYRIYGEIQKVRIKIPLNSENNISITNGSKPNTKIPRELKKEIQSAFSDKNKRRAFVEDLVRILQDYKSATTIENVTGTVEKIARHFDLDWSEKEIRITVENILSSFVKYYKDDEGREFYIDINNKRIIIGQVPKYEKYNQKERM